MILILLDIYSEVGFLDQLVVLFLIFWKVFIQFYIAALPFYIPTDSIQEFWFLHNLPSAYFFLK